MEEDLRSHSYKMINLGQEHRINDKFIYPDVKVLLEVGNYETNNLQLETYIRLKYRGKYYLCKVWKESAITTNTALETIELITEIKQFYSEVYRYQRLMKVDLKIVIPGHWEPPRRVFELDPDQTAEEIRLRPEYSYPTQKEIVLDRIKRYFKI